MNCERVREQIADYLAGRMDARTREELAAHMEDCAACRADFEELGQVWERMEELPAPEPSPAMRRRFQETLRAYQAGMEAAQVARPVQTRPGTLLRWPSRPAWQAALAASLFIAGVFGGRYLTTPQRPAEGVNDVAQLRGQVESLRQLVALSLLQEQSPSARLRGVTYTTQMAEPDDQVEQALLRAMNHDSNVNVRLSAVDALQKFAGSPAVRRALADSIPMQDSPLVQAAIVDLLVQLNDRDAAPALRKLSQDMQANEAVRQRAAWGLERLEVAK